MDKSAWPQFIADAWNAVKDRGASAIGSAANAAKQIDFSNPLHTAGIGGALGAGLGGLGSFVSAADEDETYGDRFRRAVTGALAGTALGASTGALASMGSGLGHSDSSSTASLPGATAPVVDAAGLATSLLTGNRDAIAASSKQLGNSTLRVNPAATAAWLSIPANILRRFDNEAKTQQLAAAANLASTKGFGSAANPRLANFANVLRSTLTDATTNQSKIQSRLIDPLTGDSPVARTLRKLTSDAGGGLREVPVVRSLLGAGAVDTPGLVGNKEVRDTTRALLAAGKPEKLTDVAALRGRQLAAASIKSVPWSVAKLLLGSSVDRAAAELNRAAGRSDGSIAPLLSVLGGYGGWQAAKLPPRVQHTVGEQFLEGAANRIRGGNIGAQHEKQLNSVLSHQYRNMPRFDDMLKNITTGKLPLPSGSTLRGLLRHIGSRDDPGSNAAIRRELADIIHEGKHTLPAMPSAGRRAVPYIGAGAGAAAGAAAGYALDPAVAKLLNLIAP